MRHGEERLQAGERPLVDAVDQALQRAEQAAVGHEQHRQHRRQRRRQHALLDRAARWRDRSRRRSRSGRRPQAPTSSPATLAGWPTPIAFTGSLGAVAEGDDVAVGREALRRARSDSGEALARASAAGSRSSRACRPPAPPCGARQHDASAPRLVASQALERAPASRRPAPWRRAAPLACVKISAPCRTASGR